MKKQITITLLLIVIMISGCGLPSDPVLDDFYTRNVYLGTAGDYSVGSEDYPYNEGWFEGLVLTDDPPITLEGDGRVWLELIPDLDFESVRANGKPTQVSRGIIHGFSLPIYSADFEELFLGTHVPHRWDNASDILVHIHCYLDTANTDKKFNIQLSWVHFTDNDILPNTSNDLTVETQTGTAAQYQSFHLDYTIDYDIVPADTIISSDELHFRIRRLDASADEIAGEVVITHIGIVFKQDKLGSPIP